MNKERYWVWLNEGGLEYFMKKDMPKNLLKNTLTTQTKSGVTWTVNDDGSITANGTATANISMDIPVTLEPGSYILNGTAPGSWYSSVGGVSQGPQYRTTLRESNPDKYVAADVGGGVRFSTDVTKSYVVRIYMERNAVINNKTFKLMIRDASITNDEYYPYVPSISELYNMIQTLSGNRNMTLTKAATTEEKTEEKE